MAAADNLSPQQSEELTVYPPGTLGEAFRKYRRTEEWNRKAERTREDWWRAWKRIKPIFGDCDPCTVSLEDISEWRKAIEEDVSLREAHRCLKIWRALWKVSAALKNSPRPELLRARRRPFAGGAQHRGQGRSEMWNEGEAVRLFKRAWRNAYYGLAAVIAVAWSTQLSPGDVRALRASQLVKDARTPVLHRAGQDRHARRRRSQRPGLGRPHGIFGEAWYRASR